MPVPRLTAPLAQNLQIPFYENIPPHKECAFKRSLA